MQNVKSSTVEDSHLLHFAFYIFNYHTDVYATVTMLTLVFSILRSSPAHTSSVAPVVITSSTSNKCFPVRFFSPVTLNNPAILFHRSTRFLCVCVSLIPVLAKAAGSKGRFNISLIPSAMTAAWLYPLFFSFFG